MGFLKWLLKCSIVQAFETKEVRHLATMAAGFALSWLLAHHASQDDAANISQGLGALIVGGAGYIFSRINSSNNKAVVQVAAATGEVVKPAEAKALIAQGVTAQRAVDQAAENETQAAIDAADRAAPTDKASLIADLKAGGPK